MRWPPDRCNQFSPTPVWEVAAWRVLGSRRKGEKVRTLGGFQCRAGPWRELEDVRQHPQTAQERRAEDCAFVPGHYYLTMEPIRRRASCLCKRKRSPGLEMGLCRAVKPTRA